MPQGELAIVLHTHMPYVEGFGTWPFGEEWLWEAIATSYLPLLDVLDEAADRSGGTAPVTVSLTPVLADQLERPDAMQRCVTFLEQVRPESHRLDIEELRAAGLHEPAAALQRSAAAYAAAAARLAQLGPGGVLAALGRHTAWTSSATHAVLPLVATDAGLELQLQTGIGSHRRRFGGWAGGLWLPECGYAPWLDPVLDRAGVRAACVELTGLFGLGGDRHLRPLATSDGVVLWPIDRAMIAHVWSDGGYPSGVEYRDYHNHTTHRHHAWRVDGAPYDDVAASARARADARDFVTRAIERVAGGGVCVCALDTELLGHWWYEGVTWLRAVLEEAEAAGLALTTLDDARARHEPVPAGALPVSTWGAGGDLRTWSGPAVAELAWETRAAELAVVACGGHPPERALRELLALQASDWAFLEDRRLAGGYASERAAGHARALRIALGGGETSPQLRGLAPELAGWS